MSAPLVVNTKDGVCWTRRTVTSGGIALYAPEGVCKCPEFVMATLPELAEHGIVGSADVLPVPVGPARRQTDSRADGVRAMQAALFRALDTVDQLRARVAELEAAPVQLRTDELTPGVVVIAKDMTRFTVDSVTPAKVDWRFQGRQAEGSFTSESGMEIVGHDEAGDVVQFTAAQSYKWCRDAVAELAQAKGRIAELETQLAAKDRTFDEDPIAFTLTDKALEDCDHPNGYGPNGCGGCGAFPPGDVEDDVRPQVRKLRALLAGQRAEAGERP